MPTQIREVGVRETSAVGNWEAVTPVHRLLLRSHLPPALISIFLHGPDGFFSSPSRVGADRLLNLADRLDSSHVVFIFHIRPFRLGVRETEWPCSGVTAHLSGARPRLRIWISFRSVCLPTARSRYFDRGSICFKLTHFVSGNRSGGN